MSKKEFYPFMQDTEELQLNQLQVTEQNADYKSVLVHQLQERSKEATTQIIGTMKEVAPTTSFNENGISLIKRQESGEISEQDLQVALEIYSRSFVPAAIRANQRCGDGRSEEYVEGSDYELLTRPLGPQFMGATITPAVARRLVEGFDDNSTLDSDIEEIRTAVLVTGSEVAIHTDDHGPCGCGACAKLEKGLENYEEEAGEPELARAIAGQYFVEEAYLQQRANAKDIPAGYAADKEGLPDRMAAKYGPGAKQVYVGGHDEAFVSLNYRVGEVFNREWCNAEIYRVTGKRIQFFNIDVWPFIEQAKELYPNDYNKQDAYVTACSKMQENPARVLTDGSQQVIIRS
jgi:hypothetical protein